MINAALYNVLWIEEARNDLRTITQKTALKIEKKLNDYLVRDPKKLGKPLTGKYNGLYRYRYGDYRVIYEIDLKNKVIIILRIGHRSNIY